LRSWLERGCIALVVSALLALWSVELRRVQGSLPYPQHVDERPVLNAAAHVLKTGDWNPHLYQYPSLPLYMAAGGLALGVIAASGHGPDKLSVHHLGRLAGGAYEHPEVVRVPRMLWATMGIVTLSAVAAIGFQLGGVSALLLTMAVLLVGTRIRVIASSYINVDTPMCMFTALCMLSLVCASRWPSRRVPLWLPASLCGAAMACKYNALVLLVPCLLSVVMGSRSGGLLRCCVFVAIAMFAFVVCCPYFVLDLPGFVDGIAGVAHHYGVLGHRRFEVTPGWPHLAVLASDVVGDFGWACALAAAVGCCAGHGLDARRKLVLASLPIAAALAMSRYKVHFARNSLQLLVLVPVLAGLGARTLWEWSDRRCQRLVGRKPWATRPRVRAALAALAIAVVAASLPCGPMIEAYRARPDSRNQFVAWARRHLPARTPLLLSTSLPIDVSALRDQLDIRTVDLTQADQARAAAVSGGYLLLPRWKTNSASAVRQVEQLAPGLEVLRDHTLVRSFDGKEVRPIAGDDTQCVNPALDLVRLR
jgi:hypothetical protein